MNQPPRNGTLLQWMTRIDGRLEGIERPLIDKTDHQVLEDRVRRVEEKTNRLSVKVAGIAAMMTAAGMWLKSQFFGQ